MSEKTARTHSHASNRTKARDTGDRKVVFKSVLDNPFRIQWSISAIIFYFRTHRYRFRPSVPINIQNSVLALMIRMMEGVAEYHSSRIKDSRKRKREEQGGARKKPRKGEHAADSPMTIVPNETPSDPVDGASVSLPKKESPTLQQPKISQHITVGINEVTRRLESQIQSNRLTVVTTAKQPESASPKHHLKVVLVCRADIDPPLLLDHLPHLVAAYNSTQTLDIVKLVPLPKGAESSLAQALGLRRAAVVGIDVRRGLDHWSLVSPSM